MGLQGGPISDGRESSGARRATWRLMFRLARRDMRSHRLRTLLTVLLIALPVLVVSAGMTLIATYSVSAKEGIPRELGDAQAKLSRSSEDADQVVVKQSVDGFSLDYTNIPATPLPGQSSATQAPAASVVQQVTGGTVVAQSSQNVRVVLGERRVRSSVAGIDGRNPIADGIATLKSGRWPANDQEVLVSTVGAASGIPTSGTLTLDDGGPDPRAVRVVGTVATYDRSGLVMLPDAAHIDSYLLGDSSAIRLPEIQRLNAYGFAVDSRYGRTHPDTRSGGSNDGMGVVIVMIVTGVVIMTVLLAGPALTISGVRHRRALAQLGSNGATSAMLRRYVFGQAILLGGISAVVGVGSGCLVGLLGARVIVWVRPTTGMGPADVPVTYAAGLAVVAVVACLGAALVPATQAARTNVVAALRGQVSPRRVRRGLPLVGLVLAVVGGALLFTSAIKSSGGEVGVAAGAVVLFVGATMCLPVLMALVGLLASRLPLSARVGVRDVSRQRGRSASAVGATMAVVALTTALAIGGTSNTTRQRHDYQPLALMGDGVIDGSPTSLKAALRTLSMQVPGVALAPRSVPVGLPQSEDPTVAQTPRPVPATIVGVTPPGCDIAAQAPKLVKNSASCVIASNAVPGAAGMVVADAGTLNRVLALSPANRALIERGGVLMVAPTMTTTGGVAGTDPVGDGRVRVGLATGTATQDRFRVESSRTVTREAASLRVSLARAIELGTGAEFGFVAVMTPRSARALGIKTELTGLIATQPGGVTRDVEQAISDRLPNEASLTVERGFSSSATNVIWIMMAVMAALLLIVTVIGTALVQGESAPDRATLAALGASRGTRRKIAAAQALALGLTGSLVGLLVGLVPGIAVTWPLTNTPGFGSNGIDTLPGPTIDIPWLALALVVIGVPLLAALAAAVFQRRPASLTARTT